MASSTTETRDAGRPDFFPRFSATPRISFFASKVRRIIVGTVFSMTLFSTMAPILYAVFCGVKNKMLWTLDHSPRSR